MALSPSFASALNDQINLEIQASLVYLQLSIDVEALDLPGIAQWFRAQAAEEREHARKFTKHLLDRDGHPRLGDLQLHAEPATTVLSAFQAALAHEQKVSEAIRNLYRQAQQEGDVDALPLLNWFVDEQIEEEATVSEIITRLGLIGDDGAGLLKLEEQLAARPAGDED